MSTFIQNSMGDVYRCEAELWHPAVILTVAGPEGQKPVVFAIAVKAASVAMGGRAQ